MAKSTSVQFSDLFLGYYIPLYSTQSIGNEKMSTHCFIGIWYKNDSIDYFYVHYDGQPSFIQKILLTHYKTEEEIIDLILNGDRSSLSEFNDDWHDHFFEDKNINNLTYNKSDRKEDSMEKFKKLIERRKDIPYSYLFKENDSKWIVLMYNEHRVFVTDYLSDII